MAYSSVFTSFLTYETGDKSEDALYDVFEEPLESSYIPESNISPVAVAFPVHIAVTITISVLVGLLFLAVYVQLIMVICFGYKLVSYQTILLFNILLWAALRLSLYSFYYYHCCSLVNKLHGGVKWLLVDFPSALQYFSLALLVHYFGQNLFRVFARRLEMARVDPPYRKIKCYRMLGWLVWLSSVVAFLAGNVVFFVLIWKFNEEIYVILRVVLLDGLFMLMGITLGICIILIYTTRVGKDVLEAQRVYKCWPLVISILLILIFISRAVYDVVAVKVADMKSFGLGWTFTTDMADNEFSTNQGLNHYGYIVYFIVLVVWEVIPTFLIVVFFRVRIPSSSTLNANTKVDDAVQNGRHFFDNPFRYDDETEQLIHTSSIQRSTSARMSIPTLPAHSASSIPRAGYGSTQNVYSAPSKYNNNNQSSQQTPLSNIMPGTTPPQLFTSPSNFFTDR